MNTINNISFGKSYNKEVPENKKKNHKRAVKIAVTVGVAGTAIGAAVLYKNRNSKPILKFRNFMKDGVLAPLKEKDVPFKKKISNVWNNLRQGAGNLKAGKNSSSEKFSDSIELKNKNNSSSETVSAEITTKKPVKEVEKIVDEPVNNILDEAKKNSDIALKTTEQKTQGTASDAESKKIKGSKATSKNPSSSKSGKKVKGQGKDRAQNAEKPVKNPIKQTGGRIIASAKEHSRDLRIAAGTAAIVTGGVAAGKKIDEVIEDKNDNKKFKITLNGEEFKGHLKGGIALDENDKPLNGTIAVTYDSDKKVFIEYEDGHLKESTIYGSEDDDIPETIRQYSNGHISQKFDSIELNEREGGARFQSKEIRNYDSDAILSSYLRIEDAEGKESAERYFARNIDEKGKIVGPPIESNLMKTKEYDDGLISRTISIPYDGKDALIRTSKKALDGSLEITLTSPKHGGNFAQISVDSDKKVNSYWHMAEDGAGDYAAIVIDDGKVDAGGVLGARFLAEESGIQKYKADDDTIIELSLDDEQNIRSIAEYKDIDAQIPESKILFEDGKIANEIFYDSENGEVIYKINH